MQYVCVCNMCVYAICVHAWICKGRARARARKRHPFATPRCCRSSSTTLSFRCAKPPPARGFGFRVHGLRFTVSGLRFTVSGLRFRRHLLGEDEFRVSVLGFRVWVSGLGFKVQGLRFRPHLLGENCVLLLPGAVDSRVVIMLVTDLRHGD